MNNTMPFVIPNFMQIPQDNGFNNYNNNDYLKRELEKISNNLEMIEKRLSRIETKLDINGNNYLTSEINKEKGLYML